MNHITRLDKLFRYLLIVSPTLHFETERGEDFILFKSNKFTISGNTTEFSILKKIGNKSPFYNVSILFTGNIKTKLISVDTNFVNDNNIINKCDTIFNDLYCRYIVDIDVFDQYNLPW
jgi:hypothetical protein